MRFRTFKHHNCARKTDHRFAKLTRRIFEWWKAPYKQQLLEVRCESNFLQREEHGCSFNYFGTK